MTNRELAEQIAMELFTNGFHSRADRLQLCDADNRDLGGWGFKSAVDVIERVLNNEFK